MLEFNLDDLNISTLLLERFFFLKFGYGMYKDNISWFRKFSKNYQYFFFFTGCDFVKKKVGPRHANIIKTIFLLYEDVTTKKEKEKQWAHYHLPAFAAAIKRHQKNGFSFGIFPKETPTWKLLLKLPKRESN